MGAIERGIQTNACDPPGHEPYVLPRSETSAGKAPALEEEVSRPFAGSLDVGVDRLACLLGELEANWMSGFPLTDGRTIKSRAMRGDVFNLQSDDVAPS
jgi:hypothetical protein